MNLAGFTAEVSLYQTTGHYRGAAVSSQGSYGVNLAQYLTRRVGCYQKCLSQCSPADPYCEDNCHCICYGKPCPGHGCNCWLM
jgi:hypothetical protein